MVCNCFELLLLMLIPIDACLNGFLWLKHWWLLRCQGDNTIFLLYGPPGCGKTLTAEAIAEMLRMPLYVPQNARMPWCLKTWSRWSPINAMDIHGHAIVTTIMFPTKVATLAYREGIPKPHFQSPCCWQKLRCSKTSCLDLAWQPFLDCCNHARRVIPAYIPAYLTFVVLRMCFISRTFHPDWDKLDLHPLLILLSELIITDNQIHTYIHVCIYAT